MIQGGQERLEQNMETSLAVPNERVSYLIIWEESTSLAQKRIFWHHLRPCPIFDDSGGSETVTK